MRDLLLGRTPRELDVSVAGGAAQLAAELAAALPEPRWPGGRRPEPTVHERFGTASIAWLDGRADFAQRRSEAYARPGALPDVAPGGAAADLARRDFTVNAVGLALGGPHPGELIAVDGALEDLAAGRMRVLHQRSFTDDPTRLLRLARYTARLGFQIEPLTLALAHEAIAREALGTVSGGRIGGELWLACREADDGALTVLGELGLLGALGLPPDYDRELARDARALGGPDALADMLAMAVLFHPPGEDGPAARETGRRLMEHLGFEADTRQRVLAGAFGVNALAGGILRAVRPSQLHALLDGRPVEAVAIAGALAMRERPDSARAAVGLWLSRLRHVRLEIDGQDLLAAGIAEGPELGRRLQRALERKLDGEIAEGREAELQAALGAGP